MGSSSNLMLKSNPAYIAFFIYAFVLGSLFPRIGDLQLHLGISEGTLGLALIGLPFGVQISLLVADKILKYLNIRHVMLIGIPVIGLAFYLAALVDNWMIFCCFLFLAGLCVGILEVAVNLEADRIEYLVKRRIMNRSHSFWSLGFFATGILGAGVAQLGITPSLHFLVSAFTSTLVTAYYFRNYSPAPSRPGSDTSKPQFVLPTKSIMLLVVLTLSAMLVEGSGIDWSVIYMRDVHHTLPFVSGLAFAIGAFSQFLARFFADEYVDKYGAEQTAKYSVLLMLIGVCCVTFATSPLVALIGFAFMGAGNAVIFPLAISAAAQKTDRPAAVNVASLAQISFIVFLLAPPLLGFVAETFGIRVSFGLSIPFIFISWFTLGALTEKHENQRFSR
ncbi:MAG: MFS transporter [Aestuariivita sp.]|nr:MFS transporter [Aestuariivita sp.]